MIESYIIYNGLLRLSILNLGAAIQDLRIAGIQHPLVLGYNDVQDYRHNPHYFGVIVGRCANRIANGNAMIDSHIYQLDKNQQNMHTLHGGRNGSSQRIWQVVNHTASQITLCDKLPDGHMGFPGEMHVEVTYTLLDDAYEMTITAATDRTTIANFSSHCYFNLTGEETIDQHRLLVPANRFQSVDSQLIPIGVNPSLDNHPLDLRHAKTVREPTDHSYVITDTPSTAMQHLAELSTNGLKLNLYSTEPALQVFSGSDLKVPAGKGLDGRHYGHRAGVALEPQRFVNAINTDASHQVLLPVGEQYIHRSQYQFSKKTVV